MLGWLGHWYGVHQHLNTTKPIEHGDKGITKMWNGKILMDAGLLFPDTILLHQMRVCQMTIGH